MYARFAVFLYQVEYIARVLEKCRESTCGVPISLSFRQLLVQILLLNSHLSVGHF